MATFHARPCAAPASTSGRTRRGCWSPKRRRGGCAGVAGARVHAHRPPGRRRGRDPPRRRSTAVAEVVAAQRAAAALAGAAHVRVVATAAIRRAPNRGELVDAVRDRAGVEVAVLSPDDEGRLAFAGATRTLERPLAGTIAVVDVGGMSTEIAIGTMAGGVTWLRSFEIGSGMLAGRCREDPPSRADLDAMRAAADAAFGAADVPPARPRRRGRRQRRLAADAGRAGAGRRGARARARHARRRSGGDRRPPPRPGAGARPAPACGHTGARRGRSATRDAAADRAWRAARGRGPGARGRELTVAKAQDIDVAPSEPFRQAAARIVRVRADELFEHGDGVLDTRDIERVHDMRVASRRLRAVLEIFAPCFPRSEFKGVLRDVKQLADALGERRDPDVHIDALQAFSKALAAANKPGVARLVEDLRARQTRGNEVLAAALERARERGLHERLHALADAAAGRRSWSWSRSPHEGAPRQAPGPGRAAGRQRRADRARAPRRAVLVHAGRRRPGRGRRAARHADRGEAPALRARGHRPVLRAVRRRRRPSTSRSCRTCSARSTTATCRSPRRSRSASGCRRSTPRRCARRRARRPTSTRRCSSRRRTRASTPGIAALQVHLRGRRLLLFDRFLELWDDYERKGFRARLEYAVERAQWR